MTFKITPNRNLQKLLNSNKRRGLIEDVKKEFARKGPVKVKQAIVQDMIKGISPVKGAGKWKKYSPSYKKEIEKGTSSRMQAARSKKQISPVNLRLTGQLHVSLKAFFESNALIIQFNDFLADIHNRRGAGKSKVIRRLLPTEKGETFNRKINTTLFNEVKKAVAIVAKQFSGR